MRITEMEGEAARADVGAAPGGQGEGAPRPEAPPPPAPPPPRARPPPSRRLQLDAELAMERRALRRALAQTVGVVEEARNHLVLLARTKMNLNLSDLPEAADVSAPTGEQQAQAGQQAAAAARRSPSPEELKRAAAAAQALKAQASQEVAKLKQRKAEEERERQKSAARTEEPKEALEWDCLPAVHFVDGEDSVYVDSECDFGEALSTDTPVLSAPPPTANEEFNSRVYRMHRSARAAACTALEMEDAAAAQVTAEEAAAAEAEAAAATDGAQPAVNGDHPDPSVASQDKGVDQAAAAAVEAVEVQTKEPEASPRFQFARNISPMCRSPFPVCLEFDAECKDASAEDFSAAAATGAPAASGDAPDVIDGTCFLEKMEKYARRLSAKAERRKSRTRPAEAGATSRPKRAPTRVPPTLPTQRRAERTAAAAAGPARRTPLDNTMDMRRKLQRQLEESAMRREARETNKEAGKRTRGERAGQAPSGGVREAPADGRKGAATTKPAPSPYEVKLCTSTSRLQSRRRLPRPL